MPRPPFRAPPAQPPCHGRPPLRRVLLVSLLIHGLILLPQVGPPPPRQASSSRIEARLKTAPGLATLHQAESSPSLGEQTASPPPKKHPAPLPAARVTQPSTPNGKMPDDMPADAAKTIAPTDKGIDIVGLRQYHLALGRTASQFRHYPPAAREAGRQGRVTMRLTVGDNGLPPRISLLGSSQHAELDQAALDMLRQSAAHTPLPESLRGRDFTIDLAIDFKPDDPP